MDANDTKLMYEIAKTVEVLARTVESNSKELSALRLISQALFGVVAEHPRYSDVFAQSVVNALNADESVVLNADVDDAFLDERMAWVFRLLPPPVETRVHNLRGRP